VHIYLADALSSNQPPTSIQTPYPLLFSGLGVWRY